MNKDEMMKNVIEVAERLTTKKWRGNGQYAVQDDDMGLINVGDYHQEFEDAVRYDDLEGYVKTLLDNFEEQRLEDEKLLASLEKKK